MGITVNARPVYSEDCAANRWHFKEVCVGHARNRTGDVFAHLVAGQHFGALRRTQRPHGSWRKWTAACRSLWSSVAWTEWQYDPLGTEPAGVGKHVRPVRRDVLAEPERARMA
jgi:hypothetical protein